MASSHAPFVGIHGPGVTTPAHHHTIHHSSIQSPLAQATPAGSSPQTPLQCNEDHPSNSLDTRPSTAVSAGEYQACEDQQPGGISLFGGEENSESGLLDAVAALSNISESQLDGGSAPNGLFHTVSQDSMAAFPPLSGLSIEEVLEGPSSAADDLLLSVAETSSVPPSFFVPPLWPANLPYVPPGFPSDFHDQDSDIYDDDLPHVKDQTNHFLDVSVFVRRHMEVPRDGIRRDLSLIEQPKEVTRDDLDGDRCDIQGINWEKLGLSREWVRTKRSKFESDKRLKERLNPVPGASRRIQTPAHRVPNCENYYSFVRNNTTHRAHYSHFQLRNLLAATSTNDIYYATKQKVMWTDGYGGPATCVMDLSSEVFDGHKPLLTTLGASEELVIAGGFSGEYAMTNLRSEFGTPPVLGRATEEQSGITNHIHTFPSRAGGATQAAFCSNDKVLRVLDCHTNTFTHSSHYTKPINCSATSPNGRMRAVVGDFPQTLITNAETGEPLEALTAHQDDVFSVAWADDGIHVATSAQDCRVVVWDARNWRSPLAVMESELAIPRSLRFSPVGGGPRVLISAEADDFVNVIDAVSWDKRQVIDTFGTIAGIAIAPDGSDLFVANSDYRFGGLMRFERGDHWSRGSRSPTRREMSDDEDEQSFLGIEEAEWESEGEMEKNRRVVGCRGGAARRGLGLGGREWLC